MLQTQINPHFLFNTINTIASFIRTDPMKARTLLREFAVFYRRTLEDSTERISLARELDQVQRYFNFELARFGEARLGLEVEASQTLQTMMVPPFLIQPLVENAIKHAMPTEGKLTITVTASADGDDVVIVVGDDGVGMSEETCANITQVESSTGLGTTPRWCIRASWEWVRRSPCAARGALRRRCPLSPSARSAPRAPATRRPRLPRATRRPWRS